MSLIDFSDYNVGNN